MSDKEAKFDTSQVHQLDDEGYEFLATFIVLPDGSVGLNWNSKGLDVLAEQNVTLEAMESLMGSLIARSLTESTEGKH